MSDGGARTVVGYPASDAPAAKARNTRRKARRGVVLMIDAELGNAFT